MKSKLVGLGLGLALSAVGVVVAPTMASADSTCYTGCSTPNGSTTVPVTTPVTPVVPTQEPLSSGGLALTGADIEEMAAVGAGALLVGGVLVRRSRRQRQATTA